MSDNPKHTLLIWSLVLTPVGFLFAAAVWLQRLIARSIHRAHTDSTQERLKSYDEDPWGGA